MTLLTVGQGNVHNRRKAIKHALGMDCDLFGLHEVGGQIPYLYKRPHVAKHYRVLAGEPVFGPKARGKGVRNVSQSSTTILKRHFEYLGEMHQQVSQQWTPALAVAPDRWFHAVAFQIPKTSIRVAHINVHPNAGPKVLYQSDKKNHPLVREYRESMDWLDHMLGFYAAMDYALVLTGDVNMLRNKAHNVPWSPYKVMAKHGLHYRSSRVDAIAWSREFALQDFKIIPRRKFGSDHDALKVWLNVR